MKWVKIVWPTYLGSFTYLNFKILSLIKFIHYHTHVKYILSLLVKYNKKNF